jgi:hypothetical protein
MKKMRSLVAAFTLATAGMMGLSAPAQAQTVPVQGTYAATQPSTYVSPQAMNDVARHIGVQTAYYGAGVGFTEAYASTGEHVGLEFNLHGGTASVAYAYNLDNPAASQQFYGREQTAANVDAQIAENARRNLPVYEAPRYSPVAPLLGIVGLGLLIDHIDHDHHQVYRHAAPRYDHRRYEAPRHVAPPRHPAPRRGNSGRHHR